MIKLDQKFKKSSLQVLNPIIDNNEDTPIPIRSNQFNMIELKKDKHHLLKSFKPFKKVGLLTVELELNKLNKGSISKRKALKSNENKNYCSATISGYSDGLNLLSSIESETFLGANSFSDYQKNVFEPVVDQGICAENMKRDLE